MSGRYDLGLEAAAKGNVGSWRSPSSRALLDDYRGPISVEDSEGIFVPRLLDSQDYRFSQFTAPKYPRLAMLARVQGKVELALTVEPLTGEVRNVSATSGHPLLMPSAVDAATQWRFVPGSLQSGRLNVTLDFSLTCP